jgi:hypothetical protein
MASYITYGDYFGWQITDQNNIEPGPTANPHSYPSRWDPERVYSDQNSSFLAFQGKCVQWLAAAHGAQAIGIDVRRARNYLLYSPTMRSCGAKNIGIYTVAYALSLKILSLILEGMTPK